MNYQISSDGNRITATGQFGSSRGVLMEGTNLFLNDVQGVGSFSILQKPSSIAKISKDGDKINIVPLVNNHFNPPSTDLVTPNTDLVTPSADLVTPSADLVTPSADLVTPSTDLVTPSTDLVTPSTDLVTPSNDSTIHRCHKLSHNDNTDILDDIDNIKSKLNDIKNKLPLDVFFMINNDITDIYGTIQSLIYKIK